MSELILVAVPDNTMDIVLYVLIKVIAHQMLPSLDIALQFLRHYICISKAKKGNLSRIMTG